MKELDLTGVILTGIVKSKAYLLVTIDSHIIGYRQVKKPQSGQYLSGLRLNDDTSLILEQFEIANQQNGILTGFGNAPITLRNGVLRDSTGGGRPGQMHNLYHGGGGHLILDNVQSLRCHHEGHLIKSRGHTGFITDCYFDGGESNHSRVIDLPYGGDWEIKDTVFIQSPNASNSEMFSCGVEAGHADNSRVKISGLKVYAKRKNAVFSYQKHLARLGTKSIVEYIDGGRNEFHGCDSPWG